jgi:hypothetical protein
MSYFDDASLVFIPSGTKVSKAYSVKPIDGTGDLTFSRSNDTATRVASNGLIERVRTNLALQSQTFDNASWVKAFATITANATTAPDGTLTADKLIANIGYDPVSATGNLRQTNIVATNTHTISLYAKAAEFTSIRFRENFIVGAFLTIDLTNGSITGAGSQYINPTATAVGDGWYRISFVTPATADLDKYSIRVANTGDGTSGVFIWGFQYEVSDFGPTDYIATTTAAVSVGPVANVPRLDYLGSSCPRLLLEPQRTNAITFSEQMNNAAWIKNVNAAVTANQAISPDGYQNADLVSNTLVGGGMDYYQLLTGSASTTYTYSVFVKAATHTKCALRAFVGATSPFTTTPAAYFDLATASVIQSYGSATNAKIEAVGSNGWYRVSMTFPTIGTSHYLNLFPLSDTYTLSASNAPLNYSSTGGVYFWGAQYEIGAYATSYIPTLGAAVTRGVDSCYKTGISSLIGQTEGTLFADIEINANNTDNFNRLLSVGNGTSSNRILILAENTEVFRFYVQTGGALQVDIVTSTSIFGGRHKVAFAYKANDFIAYVDGVQVGSDTSGTVPNTTNVYLGTHESGSTQPLEGLVQQALLFKTRLTNAQLAELTTL